MESGRKGGGESWGGKVKGSGVYSGRVGEGGGGERA